MGSQLTIISCPVTVPDDYSPGELISTKHVQSPANVASPLILLESAIHCLIHIEVLWTFQMALLRGQFCLLRSRLSVVCRLSFVDPAKTVRRIYIPFGRYTCEVHRHVVSDRGPWPPKEKKENL